MAYGQFLYGTSWFGSDSQIDPPDVSPVDLMAYLPEYYRGIRDFRELLASEGEEFGALWSANGGVLDQYFVSTATWGLHLWESELGMSVDTTKPIQRRREQINAKLRGTGTTTRQMLIDTAAAFSGGEVDVIEYPAEYRFVVKFVGVHGIPPNMAGLIAVLEQIKPTHLTYSFEYTYAVWDDLLELRWTDTWGKKWAQLRTYGGV